MACSRCGCDPSPALAHRRESQCIEALKRALGESQSARSQLEQDLAEMTKRVPGPLRAKKPDKQEEKP